jgi:hypothetical protein
MRDTPLNEYELLPAMMEADPPSALLYQKKMGSTLYVAITTCPDVAFAVSRLVWFNQNPNEEHYHAVDRVIQFLHSTRYKAICYGGDTGRKGAQAFICASDTSFADNSADRKSSQGYIMTLFNGPISWRANKQDTVTT